MTQKDFLRFLFKLLGLYFIVRFGPTLISYPSYILSGYINLSSVIVMLVMLTLTIIILKLLLFTPDKIINRLVSKKTDEMEQKQDEQSPIQEIIWYANVILGSYLIISSSILLFTDIGILTFNSSLDFNPSNFFGDSIYESIIFNFSKTIMGCLLICFSQSIAKALAAKNMIKG